KMDMAFGDNFVNEQEVDPVAEFVAREQDQLAGLENEIPPVAISTPAMASNTDDEEEEKKKEEWREAARKELEEWYKHHAEAISKTKTTNRNAEKQFVAEADEVEPGTEWERIAKLCDFNPKSSRTSKD
ncbi:unnamed protein product, partial [Heterotrigona itama]